MDRYDEKKSATDEVAVSSSHTETHRDISTDRGVVTDRDVVTGRDVAPNRQGYQDSRLADREIDVVTNRSVEDREHHAEANRDVDEEDEIVREGDVLGLGGAVVPKAPGDPTTEHDEASLAKRRSRALGDEPTGVAAVDPTKQGGATGIDMGSGGQGVLRRRP